jgi:hypothetical protein
MTTKRRTIRRGGRGRITPEVIAAWRAGDYGALHLALHLHPWCHSPLPKEIICLGVDQNSPPHFLDVQQREDWRQAAALQAELLKIAGWPDCRQAYRKNLADALKWQRYWQGAGAISRARRPGHRLRSGLASARPGESRNRSRLSSATA